ncbi:hypothetical protein BGX34_006134 [Mortierella sp. NVP85]|nr:hypothetical protein BGX34_006134 [Mortierella sp. NVP85]
MIPRSTSRISFALLIISLLSGFTQLISSIHAQTFKPVGLPRPASSFIDGRGLFIAAGYPFGDSAITGGGPRSQVFNIDLSVSWNTNDPRFEKLPDSPFINYGPSAISADGLQWVIFSRSTANVYSFETAGWTIPSITPSDFTAGEELAATDPQSGLVYIPRVNSGSLPQDFLMRLDLTSMSYDRLSTMDDVLITNDYAVAWSASLGKLLLVGGYRGSTFDRTLPALYTFSYNAKDGWGDLTMTAKGAVPQPRYGACLVPASGGSKMILFGGVGIQAFKPITLPSIHILDVATMTWTKGPDVPVKDQRFHAACAVSNDQFIAWGGALNDEFAVLSGQVPQNSTLVYDLKTNKWISTYTAGPALPTTRRSLMPSASGSSPPSGETNSNSDPSGGISRITIIAVSALGVAGIALGVGGIIMCRGRRRRAQGVPQESDCIPLEPGYKSQEPDCKPRAPEVSIVKTPFSTDHPGGDLQKSVNNISEVERHIPRNPQLFTKSPSEDFCPAEHVTAASQLSRNPQSCIPQIPRQALHPGGPHATLLSQPPQNPHSVADKDT